ncbi:hypothetical protein AGABI1DRAFT_42515 [Agaricus bisporus var. burnettii JB137-S8]|uniref:VTT domain-containing protein n=1 Tax=Agaricus bisporus var. burnettii (strain JB137-S8 / ATCC MYA-4627 / FGSC 10392) TaxID=597362 RepID=K5WRZ8_AGABU|nr:uncharacterized protein AGABI1DRAFT_42515 [Agaricus bisporus var. burnettii JB137-S8]EKM78151.1 hypothetical protein AGABI1DRAFT_42515 [Agaricus bisporus var. burnettii JB137-S8]
MYTLNTVADDDDDSSSRRSSNTSPLLSSDSQSYGTTPNSQSRPSSGKVILHATLKMACIFLVSTLLLGGVLWIALPTLDDADRPLLRIPKSFSQLQDLNGLLKKYRDIYPYRIVVCYVITYLFLQAFSLPGSMYLSILGGAVWGVTRALPLTCCCVATGATLCYLISAALGPALLTIPKWKAVLDKWADKIQANKENMISFLIVLRIAPLPPHWVVNVLCPHVGIGIVPFWISTALGILGVTVIHTTIGGGLDDMTSSDDFHLISWRNFFTLAAIAVGVLIPVGLRYWFRQRVQDIEEQGGLMAEPIEDPYVDDPEDRILAVGPPGLGLAKKAGERLLLRREEEDDESSLESFYDEDEDIILEAGPLIPDKAGEERLLVDVGSSSSSSLDSVINLTPGATHPLARR